MPEETAPNPMPVPRNWWRDLRLALGFMTRLPVGAVDGDLAAAARKAVKAKAAGRPRRKTRG